MPRASVRGPLPRVSVVIPCYRQAHYLPHAIASALGQTHPPHELVVVDDGSPDDVSAVVAAFPGVQCLTQENRGLSAARNAGMARSSGDAVVFLDADDRLLPDALAIGRAALAQHPSAALVWGFNRPVDGEGRVLGPVSNPWSADEASYADLLARNVVGPPVGVMFRREALAACGGFSPRARAAEDYELYLRLSREHQLRCHGRLVAEYRVHDANMSADNRLMLCGVLGALEAQADHVRGDRELLRAWREGRRWARRQYYGRPRVEAIGEDVRRRRWVRAAAGALRLLLRDPALVVREAWARMGLGGTGSTAR